MTTTERAVATSPQPRVRRHHQDLEELQNFLEQSGLKEQERLPPERELAEALGLSRPRLRNALKKLSAKGLIWRHVGRGTFLGPAPVLTGQNRGLPDMTNPREIMEARLAIEPELARMAAVRGTRADFEEMDMCLEKLKESANHTTWSNWDTRLHRVIAKAAENKVLLAVFDLVHSSRNDELWGDLRQAYNTPERLSELHREHTGLVRKIQARSPKDAEAAMRDHLRSVRRTIFGEY